jgi:WASH complex subunit 7
LLQGVQYACEIGHLLKTITNLHAALAKPMTKTAVLALCKLVELLKGIQHMYHRHYMTTAQSINHVVQHLAFQALSIIVSAKVCVCLSPLVESCSYNLTQQVTNNN